ncbi:hypothetical protein Pint_23310 [Pistacia integerrima]|uniref:Uncharacterized protein n=1 Tax=Pistacia integerrima TaxID=434235 RepID=A0ACC0YJT3_9ROSI|nr:hypothetical protein Pint_23310 [Pistacia integerrima]
MGLVSLPLLQVFSLFFFFFFFFLNYVDYLNEFIFLLIYVRAKKCPWPKQAQRLRHLQQSSEP